MGQQLITIDDISGQPITDGEHITFSVNGTAYEMDLDQDNAREFHQTLSIYTSKATKVEAKRQTVPAANPKKKRDPEYLKAVREWARENGHEVSDRGRIAAEIEEAYAAANK